MTQKMKNIKNVFTTKRNNHGLFFQMAVFALFGMMILFSGQTLAQNVCTPIMTVTEGNLAPGGPLSFMVSSGLGSVTAQHVSAGTGMYSMAVVGVPTNATVPPIVFAPPGTFNQVEANFTCPSLNQATAFTIRAASLFHAININVQCGAAGCTRTQGYWKNHAEVWVGRSVMLGTRNYTQAELLSIFDTPVTGNGLISLSHQLIAAKLNAPPGTILPASVATAMAAADAMIGGLVVPSVGGGSLSTDSTSSLTSTLDQFNNGNTRGGPPHCR